MLTHGAGGRVKVIVQRRRTFTHKPSAYGGDFVPYDARGMECGLRTGRKTSVSGATQRVNGGLGEVVKLYTEH